MNSINDSVSFPSKSVDWCRTHSVKGYSEWIGISDSLLYPEANFRHLWEKLVILFFSTKKRTNEGISDNENILNEWTQFEIKHDKVIYSSQKKRRIKHTIFTCEKIHDTSHENRWYLMPAESEKSHEDCTPEDDEANHRAGNTQILHSCAQRFEKKKKIWTKTLDILFTRFIFSLFLCI